ncbi:Rsd/AlgQ family anti-sigma factor [Alteromonas lipolytica]|uniref:Anti-RNA polymerase sigma 70 factor n=1 Tax=Alteromonas lipolytica TaxID=1856405 RepID=A0A1E8F8M2_9ALTE|nr:Rsd/AlgQ family anti-sigma factor [Alteromonas lipolytica]OFI32126.1 anti-RNA polymerase sigma 70 factor [Alteromonas lipolytica]GGF83682.1 sigma D regulator [Alteromonas lipolytica]
MLNQLETAQQRWGGASKTIDNWLDERKQLLIQYCHLAGVNYQSAHALPSESEVNDFCAILMDYLSVGHFEVYEMLVSDDQDGQRLKQQIFPLISKTTDQALDFNDQFAEGYTQENANLFEDAVTKLGAALDDRFELEDQLIQRMHRLADHSLTN